MRGPGGRRAPVRTFATRPRPERRERASCALCGASETEPLWDCGDYAFARCLGCGQVRQDPMPPPEAAAARYDEEYLAYEVAHEDAYRDLELRSLEDLGLEREAEALRARRESSGQRPRVLDVGCATGALLAALRDRGWEPSGVEIGPSMAAYGRERRGLPIHAGGLESARFAPASFELVHASHLVEHLVDPASFVDEARRVLVPGGLLALTTPNVDGFQARALGWRWRSAIYDHLYLFSVRTLGALLESRGFATLRLITWGGWAAGLKPAFLKRPLDRWAKRSGRGDVMAILARGPA